MPRLLGVDIPTDRPTVISLTYLYGVGPKIARELCIHHTAAILVLILGKSLSSVTDCLLTLAEHDRGVGNHLEVSHAASKIQQSALERKTTTQNFS